MRSCDTRTRSGLVPTSFSSLRTSTSMTKKSSSSKSSSPESTASSQCAKHHDHRITEADNQEPAPGDRPVAEGQPGQPAQPAEASSAAQAPEADSDEATYWPGCAKCGLTLTCECKRLWARHKGSPLSFGPGRRWASAWHVTLTEFQFQHLREGGGRDYWQMAVTADESRHASDLDRLIYRVLLHHKALYLLTH